MEKKKLMLVAVSVGVVLVIIFSSAILIFRPGSGGTAVSETSSAISSENRSATTDPSELTRDSAYMGLQDPNTASPLHSTIIENGNTVISVPKPAVTVVPAVPAAAPAVSAPAKPAPKPQPVAAAPVKPAPETPKKAFRDYWVQAGSFSTRDRADGVKNTLGTKGITAIISNQEINGNTYYRVRIGPYASQNEADYWLAMIKAIDGFQESQIWESQSFR
jgi:DedD protein